ncbi:hypothetical protein AWA2045_30870 (plasmid) [Lactiplantibacillus plantarum]|nr:hypothetical protein AWA2045_30870 [Lactiplantibacillus plantarum]
MLQAIDGSKEHSNQIVSRVESLESKFQKLDQTANCALKKANSNYSLIVQSMKLLRRSPGISTLYASDSNSLTISSEFIEYNKG